MKNNILSLREEIFTHLKEKAHSYEGAPSNELREYKLNQEILAKRSYSASSIDELLQQVNTSQVTYIGDFHTFDQNIRNILRIVRTQIQKKKECAIALEMVGRENQSYIDAFLGGYITELEFLESISYDNSWRFPWSHYKMIFELAKSHNIPIFAINTEGGLSKRDQFASEQITAILKNGNEQGLIVLYGELHITPNKIPRLVKELNPSIRQTIIHQNLDEVYWGLVKNNQEHEIVKFTSHEFCIIAAPPWIKYESMIYWYENLCDDPDFDIHEYIIENGRKTFTNDIQDNFLLLCEQLIETTNLNILPSQYEDFNLYDHKNLEFIQEQILKLPSDQVKLYNSLIAMGFSFRLENSNIYYCSSYSVNRLAYLAGTHIFNLYGSFPKKGSKTEFFVFQAYQYMFAYFFSKVINPHRKCMLYKDFQINQNLLVPLLIDSYPSDELVKRYEKTDLVLAAMDLGHFLGEYFYKKILLDNESPLDLQSFLSSLKCDGFSFQRVKNEILKGFDYKEHFKRYF